MVVVSSLQTQVPVLSRMPLVISTSEYGARVLAQQGTWWCRPENEEDEEDEESDIQLEGCTKRAQPREPVIAN